MIERDPGRLKIQYSCIIGICRRDLKLDRPPEPGELANWSFTDAGQLVIPDGLSFAEAQYVLANPKKLINEWVGNDTMPPILPDDDPRNKPRTVAQANADILANAHLISAAPDLLAACRMVLDDPGLTAIANEVIRSAIAKAEGQPGGR